MPLDQDEAVDLIRESWALATTNRPVMARRFYSILFANHPEVEHLFKGDIDQQAKKLADTLDFVVDNLEEPDLWVEAVKDLAVRHVAYGAEPAHYGAVGSSLLETFSTTLGRQFTPEMRQAWEETYAALSSLMIDTAYPK